MPFPDIASIERRLDTFGRQIAEAKSGPIAPAALSGELETLLPSLRRFLDSQKTAPPTAAGTAVPASVLRRIWVRAFWATTCLWLIVILAAGYLLGFWQMPVR